MASVNNRPRRTIKRSTIKKVPKAALERKRKAKVRTAARGNVKAKVSSGSKKQTKKPTGSSSSTGQKKYYAMPKKMRDKYKK